MHLAALGIDDDRPIHVGIEVDGLARLADVMGGELRHHRHAAEREGDEGARAGRLHQLDLDRETCCTRTGKLGGITAEMLRADTQRHRPAGAARQARAIAGQRQDGAIIQPHRHGGRR